MVDVEAVQLAVADDVDARRFLGRDDDARMASDYELVKTYIGLETPFDVKTSYTNEFLDRSIKMPK